MQAFYTALACATRPKTTGACPYGRWVGEPEHHEGWPPVSGRLQTDRGEKGVFQSPERCSLNGLLVHRLGVHTRMICDSCELDHREGRGQQQYQPPPPPTSVAAGKQPVRNPPQVPVQSAQHTQPQQQQTGPARPKFPAGHRSTCCRRFYQRKHKYKGRYACYGGRPCQHCVQANNGAPAGSKEYAKQLKTGRAIHQPARRVSGSSMCKECRQLRSPGSCNGYSPCQYCLAEDLKYEHDIHINPRTWASEDDEKGGSGAPPSGGSGQGGYGGGGGVHYGGSGAGAGGGQSGFPSCQPESDYNAGYQRQAGGQSQECTAQNQTAVTGVNGAKPLAAAITSRTPLGQLGVSAANKSHHGSSAKSASVNNAIKNLSLGPSKVVKSSATAVKKAPAARAPPQVKIPAPKVSNAKAPVAAKVKAMQKKPAAPAKTTARTIVKPPKAPGRKK
ncbi:hypothetical protein EK21DRAFT_85170 [Setomelanomma holmii]|uniref:Uncharacterized protein n=1 Tax=Setomelanomma holmii TaxID=210430 RepID=A0A9P4LSA8_9PLEO|nr:hypothetical protein EK21DRAFT_85170 [Setomelanomma holmii]